MQCGTPTYTYSSCTPTYLWCGTPTYRPYFPLSRLHQHHQSWGINIEAPAALLLPRPITRLGTSSPAPRDLHNRMAYLHIIVLKASVSRQSPPSSTAPTQLARFPHTQAPASTPTPTHLLGTWPLSRLTIFSRSTPTPRTHPSGTQPFAYYPTPPHPQQVYASHLFPAHHCRTPHHTSTITPVPCPIHHPLQQACMLPLHHIPHPGS